MMRLSNLYFNQRVMQHRKMFSVTPTSVEEEVNDSDHEASDQVAIEPHRSTRICTTPEWCDDPVLDIMLLDNNETTSYGEAMVGPDSDEWLEAIKSERGSMYKKTKCRLWQNGSMVVRQMSTDGFQKEDRQ